MDDVAPLHRFVDDFVIKVSKVEAFFFNEPLENRETKKIKADIVRVIFGVFVTDPNDFNFMSTFTAHSKTNRTFIRAIVLLFFFL